MGIIRVGTLHDFRRSEHKRGITDPQEGKKIVGTRLKVKEVVGPDAPGADTLARFGLHIIGPDARVITGGGRFQRAFDAPDCFVLCASTRRSASTMRHFEGAETCVEIVDLDGFFVSLTNSLFPRVPVRFAGIHQVMYQVRDEDWNGNNWGTHPSLIKEPIFFPQCELRAIWEPEVALPIWPIILSDYRLTRYCRLVDVA